MEMAGTLGIKGFIIKLVCFAPEKNKTGVSPMTTKFHPFKMISCRSGRIKEYVEVFNWMEPYPYKIS